MKEHKKFMAKLKPTPVVPQKREIPEGVFPVELCGYTAYDKEKIPFEVFASGYFSILSRENILTRYGNAEDLERDIRAIMSGVLRRILVAKEIDVIAVERSSLSKQIMEYLTEELSLLGIKVERFELTKIIAVE